MPWPSAPLPALPLGGRTKRGRRGVPGGGPGSGTSGGPRRAPEPLAKPGSPESGRGGPQKPQLAAGKAAATAAAAALLPSRSSPSRGAPLSLTAEAGAKRPERPRTTGAGAETPRGGHGSPQPPEPPGALPVPRPAQTGSSRPPLLMLLSAPPGLLSRGKPPFWFLFSFLFFFLPSSEPDFLYFSSPRSLNGS